VFRVVWVEAKEAVANGLYNTT